MNSKIIHFIFFANYFVGFLALALSFETAFQMGIPFCSGTYYGLLFCVTVWYYTYAYRGASNNPGSTNPRTHWYYTHRSFIGKSQAIVLFVSILLGLLLVLENWRGIISLPIYFWLLFLILILSAAFYYGLVPRSLYSFNLRNTGWLKAFVIGFVWAGCVNILPVAMAHIEHGTDITQPGLMLWLFVKNWMFCTVNAIMFDIKDYEDDSNIQLKTFVVRFGLYNTIYFVLTPLLMVGLTALLIFTDYRHYPTVSIFLNAIPFFCLLLVAFSLNTPKRILYYLIVIDGLLLVKAVCGISGALYMQHFQI